MSWFQSHSFKFRKPNRISIPTVFKSRQASFFSPNYPVNLESLCFLRQGIVEVYIYVQGADIHPLCRAFFVLFHCSSLHHSWSFPWSCGSHFNALSCREMCPLPHNKQSNNLSHNLHRRDYHQSVRTFLSSSS